MKEETYDEFVHKSGGSGKWRHLISTSSERETYDCDEILFYFDETPYPYLRSALVMENFWQQFGEDQNT